MPGDQGKLYRLVLEDAIALIREHAESVGELVPWPPVELPGAQPEGAASAAADH